MVLFKIMTWNVENLFRVGNPAGPETPDEFSQKLDRLAEVILALDPDVLALQEVGDAFPDLEARLQGRYPHTRLSAHPDPRGIRVGFLSKLAIEAHQEIVEFPVEGLPQVPGLDSRGNLTDIRQLGRGALLIRVRPQPGRPIHLLTAHLKSKLLTFPSATGGERFSPHDENERARVAGLALLKRTAEAVALRVKANQLLEDNARQALILLGDMNDVTAAATTQLLQGPAGSEIGTRGFDQPDQGDDTRLFNLAPRIAPERRFSRIYQGQQELIDHIFVSQELLPGRPRRLPNVDSRVDLAGTLPSIGADPGTRRGKPGSDHAPVTAVFEL